MIPSGLELIDGYRRRELSPVEVTRAVLAHIERWEPHLRATWAQDSEATLDMARASERRWAAGEAGALDGVPVTLKDNIATRGVAMPLGTAASELVPMADDAPPAARLREAGAVFVAKTTMPDYGMLSSGLSSFHALARNPWNLARNPGGSSAGAGAAAAAGYGPLHVGTDIGGSLRLPAGWCGIFTLKPSLGRIPIKPPYAGRVAGPMTRTVHDSARMMAVLSQPDWRDTMSLPYQAIDWMALEGRPRKGMRLGLLLDAGWGLPVDPQIAAAVTEAARLFEREGAIVEVMPAFGKREHLDGMDRFWRFRSWLDISALPVERRERVLPYIRAWAEGGAGASATELFQGYNQMAAMREAAVAACRPYDFVLTPTSPVGPYAAEWASPTNDPARPLEHIGFTLPYNMSEQPAASINCGFDREGLPIGLQIVGQRHDDLGVLQLSAAYERLRGPLRPWPEPPAAS